MRNGKIRFFAKTGLSSKYLITTNTAGYDINFVKTDFSFTALNVKVASDTLYVP